MAHSFSSFVLVFLLFATTSYAIPVGEVNVICKQTPDPTFCSTILNSNPNANLVDITQYTINIAQANITQTIKYINYLIAKYVKDPIAKNHYTSCLEYFGTEGALDDIKYTGELLKKGDYLGVRVAVSSVRSDVDDCISGDSPSDPPYHDPSMLPQYAKILNLVVDIIIVLAKSLVR